MLEYIKTVLQKVSFDSKLFEKELQKGIKMLMPDEVTQLKQWCYDCFGQGHQLILNRYFQSSLS
jgi:hypothetical protein